MKHIFGFVVQGGEYGGRNRAGLELRAMATRVALPFSDGLRRIHKNVKQSIISTQNYQELRVATQDLNLN
jgi:hypothetical protein